MILVDSSVWIDYFRGIPTAQCDMLDGLLGVGPAAIGDIILAEVLQGFTTEEDFREALALLSSLPLVTIAGCDIAIQAARNFRGLRARGITVRKTIDTLIATRCIADGHALLYDGRDFDPFVEHLGLVSAMAG